MLVKGIVCSDGFCNSELKAYSLCHIILMAHLNILFSCSVEIARSQSNFKNQEAGCQCQRLFWNKQRGALPAEGGQAEKGSHRRQRQGPWVKLTRLCVKDTLHLF